jgi:cell division protein FtsX
MQIKTTNIKRKSMASQAAIITLSILFALATNIYGHNIQVAIAAKNNNRFSAVTITRSASDPNQTSTAKDIKS